MYGDIADVGRLQRVCVFHGTAEGGYDSLHVLGKAELICLIEKDCKVGHLDVNTGQVW